MTTTQLPQLRLHNQHLTHTTFTNPYEVVSWLGAVQAQDFASALWALQLRMSNSSEKIVEEAFNQGRIVRTHVMRPTWHFVAPEDIRWLQALTAPRVNAVSAYYFRKFGLTDTVFARSNMAIAKALKGGKSFTRDELSAVFTSIGLESVGMRFGYLIIRAELDALICSGPRRGKQFTYMLLDDRVPSSEVFSKDESLAKLTMRYFTGHGPAQIQDFVWWSGLTVADGKRGLDLVGSALEQIECDGKTYWLNRKLTAPKSAPAQAFLLPNYDEYTIAYKDRSAFLDTEEVTTLDARGSIIFNHSVVVNGKIVGSWRRTINKDVVVVEVRFFQRLAEKDHLLFEDAVDRYARFIDKRPRIVEI